MVTLVGGEGVMKLIFSLLFYVLGWEFSVIKGENRRKIEIGYHVYHLYTWKIPEKLSNPQNKPSHHLQYHLQLMIKRCRGEEVGHQLWEVTRKGAVKKGILLCRSVWTFSTDRSYQRSGLLPGAERRHITNGDFPGKGILLYSFSKLYLPFLKNTQLKMILMPVRHILGWYILAPCNSIC